MKKPYLLALGAALFALAGCLQSINGHEPTAENANASLNSPLTLPNDFSLPVAFDYTLPIVELEIEGIVTPTLIDSATTQLVLFDSAKDILSDLDITGSSRVSVLGGDGSLDVQAVENIRVEYPGLGVTTPAYVTSWKTTGVPELAQGSFDAVSPLLLHDGPPTFTIFDQVKDQIDVYFDLESVSGFDDAIRLPLQKCDRFSLCIEVELETADGDVFLRNLFVDNGSGAAISIIEDRWPANIQLGERIAGGSGAAGLIYSSEGPDLFLRIGEEHIGPIKSSSEPVYKTAEEADGRIGSGFLRQTRYAIDRFNNELLIARTPNLLQPLPVVRRAMRATVIKDWSGYLVIAPDDLAATGLQEGDIIRTIDNQPISSTYALSARLKLENPGETTFCWDRPETGETSLCASFDAPQQ